MPAASPSLDHFDAAAMEHDVADASTTTRRARSSARPGARRAGASVPVGRRTPPGATAPTARRTAGSGRSMSVRARLLAGFAGMAALVVVVGAIGLRSMNRLDDAAHSLKVDGLDASVTIDKFRMDVLEGHAHALATALASDETTRSENRSEYEEHDQSADEHYKIATTKYSLPDAVISGLKESRGHLDRYREVRDEQFIPAALAGRSAERDSALVKALAELDAFNATYDELIIANDADNVRLEQVANSTAASGRRMSMTFIAASLVAAVLLAWFISRSILRPTNEVKDLLEAVAQGDLTVRSGNDRNDELGQMSASLNATLENTQSTISMIGTSAVELTSSSEELAASAGQVAANVQTAAAGNRGDDRVDPGDRPERSGGEPGRRSGGRARR